RPRRRQATTRYHTKFAIVLPGSPSTDPGDHDGPIRMIAMDRCAQSAPFTTSPGRLRGAQSVCGTRRAEDPRRPQADGAAHAGRVPAGEPPPVVTITTRDPEARSAPSLVQRNFRADEPDQLWVADITYVPTETTEESVIFGGPPGGMEVARK